MKRGKKLTSDLPVTCQWFHRTHRQPLGRDEEWDTGTEGGRGGGGDARGRGRGRDSSAGRSTSSGSNGSSKRERSPSSENLRGDGVPAERHVDSTRGQAKHKNQEGVRNIKEVKGVNASGVATKTTIHLDTTQIELLTRTWTSTSGLFAERMDTIDYEQIAKRLNTMQTTEHGTSPKPNTSASVKKYFHNHHKH